MNSMNEPSAQHRQEAEGVWIFCGGGQFASGAFSTKDNAETWIAEHGLTGLLTWYPLDEGMYEWAVRSGHFTPTKEHQKTGEFVGQFSCGAVHFHYERGKRAGEQ